MKKLVRNLVDEAVGVANGVANSLANPQGQNNNRYGNAPQQPYPPQPSQYRYGANPGVPVPQSAPYAHPTAQYYHPPQNAQAPAAQQYYPPRPTGQQYQAPPSQQQPAQNPSWNYAQPTAYGPQPPNAHPPHPGTYPPTNSAQYHAPPPHQAAPATSYQPQYGQQPPPPQPAQYQQPYHQLYQQGHQYYPPPVAAAPAPQESGITSLTPTIATPHPPSQSSTNPPPQQNYFDSAPPPQSAQAQRETKQNTQTPAAPSYQPQYAPPQPQPHPGPISGIPLGAQDPLAPLTSQMNNLNVQSNGRSQDELPRGVPPVRASGPPNEIIAFCPESRAVDYPLYWYRLPDIPNFFVCSRCYADNIQSTHLAGQFERIHQPEGSVSTCDFWFPRVKQILWPQAIQTNDLTTLRVYMMKRQNIPACRGRVFSIGAEGGSWYGLVQPGIIDDFLACEACYEDYIAGSAFEPRFSLYRKQGEQEKWVCDLCVPHVMRAAEKMSKINDWQGFVVTTTRRLKLPEREGKEMPTNGANWFVPRQKIKRMRVCETCFLDKIALTRFDSEFQPYTTSSGFGGLLKELIVESSCSMASIPLAASLESALNQRNFAVFWAAAETIISVAPCSVNGVVGSNWWTLAGGCDALSVCEACYTGILKTTDTAQHFERARRDSTKAIVCSFCPANPRFVQFVNRFAETLDKGVITYFSDYVRKWAGVTPCPRLDHRRGGTWWGYEEALACQECYVSFVADTSLADGLPWKGKYDERAICCQMWSPRMRNLWQEACGAGSPGSPESQAALQRFLAFGLRRMQTYNATIPQINNMEKLKLLKYKQALQQGRLGLQYSAMDGRIGLVGNTNGYVYGNSSMGWYDTPDGVTGAQMMNNMRVGLADASNTNDTMKIVQLKAIWAEVE